jgi:hypothetical protein
MIREPVEMLIVGTMDRLESFLHGALKNAPRRDGVAFKELVLVA